MPIGRVDTASAKEQFGAMFIHRQCRAQNAAAGKGNLHHSQGALHFAIFAAAAVQDIKNPADIHLCQLRQRFLRRVKLHKRQRQPPQSIGNRPAAHQRYFALRRVAAD